MITLYRIRTVPEHKASAEIAAIYHDIKQTLRVSGVDLPISAWAGHGRVFPALWEALRPAASSKAFEESADRLRVLTVQAAGRLGRLAVLGSARLGPSQAYQAKASLMLYHYMNPKLLLLAASAARALQGEPPVRASRRPHGNGDGNGAALERGIPVRMAAMELVDERPADHALRDLFKDIRKVMNLPALAPEYRTLGLWPAYLSAAWKVLRPLVRSPKFLEAAQALSAQAEELARGLPHPPALPLASLKEEGSDLAGAIEAAASFQRALPATALSIALLALDWETPEALSVSPFPTGAVAEAARA